MPSIDKSVTKGHPILFGLLVALAGVEGCISTWLSAKFNQNHNQPSNAIRDRARFLAFTSWFTFIFSLLYMLLFFHSTNGDSVLVSVLSHGIFLGLAWVLWTAGAASITAALDGGHNCSNIDYQFVYCNQLNALMGFAWASWLIVTLGLVVVLGLAIRTTRRGDSLKRTGLV